MMTKAEVRKEAAERAMVWRNAVEQDDDRPPMPEKEFDAFCEAQAQLFDVAANSGSVDDLVAAKKTVKSNVEKARQQ